MKKSVLSFALCCAVLFLSAQNKPYTCRYPLHFSDKKEAPRGRSIHQEEAEEYAAYDLSTDAQWDSLRQVRTGSPKRMVSHRTRSCNLTKRVYGWHPYWSNGLQVNYDWAGLTDLCYFSYDVNPANGNASSTHGWSTATVVTDAQANGVNVTLCATLFSGHTTFFGSSTSQQTLITNLITLVNARGAHGVNIDFEGMSASHKVPFTNFMIDLCDQMHAAIPGSEVSIALYAVDWGGVFDMAALDPYVDLFIIMGYDYYYSGSTTAGPESPLYNFQPSYNYTLTRTISYYLKQGASESKLLLGLPWYGREWATTGSTIPSATTGTGTSSVTYAVMRDNLSGYYSSPQWDVNSYSSWYPSYRGGQWWQAFIDGAYSLGKRFDIVNQMGIGGIGIWALGYDDGYSDLWNLISDKFSDCAIVPCTDTLYDLGGPTRNYYNYEDYVTTISPTGATGLSMNFTSFNTELNYDTLWLYDGASTSAPLIGTYHGSAGPGLINASGGSLTLRFKSDVSTVSSGWQAIWNCSIDNTAPVTTVSVPGGWATTDFTASFTDSDAGSGIAKSYYQVLEFNGTEWRANNSRGFFSDDFDSAIHPDWTAPTGTWSISGACLEQSDQSITNTNIYASLTQDLSNQYLYHWSGRIDGTGANRRAGFHFFCDDASLPNRGNSYFVWFRADQSLCEFYKVSSDVFSLEHSVPMTVNAGQWYDYKVIYDRISGKMEVYQDNASVGSWTDPSPYSNGNAISFRSGNCNYMVNDLKVYRSRLPSVTVTVGPASTQDVRYQNPDPLTPSCRVRSITNDVAGNLSAAAMQDVNVDWTIPSDALVADGFSADTDTAYSLTELSSNWSTCADPHSDVVRYWYSIGTSAGATDILSWSDHALLTDVTQTGLSLIPGQWYYFNVRSENGAGLVSNVSSSDGQVVMLSTGIPDPEEAVGLTVFPNPFSESSSVIYTLASSSEVTFSLTDLQGRTVWSSGAEMRSAGMHSISIDKNRIGLSAGVYLLKMSTKEKELVRKILVE